jgi:hypothetical protein
MAMRLRDMIRTYALPDNRTELPRGTIPGMDIVALMNGSAEDLHPELIGRVVDSPLGLMVKHPLFSGMVTADGRLNALSNHIFSQRKAAFDEAVAFRDFTRALRLTERPWRAERARQFAEESDVSDSELVKIMRLVWRDSENIFQVVDEIEALFAMIDERGIRAQLMDTHEKVVFDALPDTVFVYRGATTDNEYGFSWTLNPRIAGWFATGFEVAGKILIGQVRRDDILFLAFDRNEGEVVISDPTGIEVLARLDPSRHEIRFTDEPSEHTPRYVAIPDQDALMAALCEVSLLATLPSTGRLHWLAVAQRTQSLIQAGAAGNATVAYLFGLIHACCRETEDDDSDRRARAVQMVQILRDRQLVVISEDEADLLRTAIATYAYAPAGWSATLAVCFDAQRLELARRGLPVDEWTLSTPQAVSLLRH